MLILFLFLIFSNKIKIHTYPQCILQPENLLLDKNGALKVSDFGLSTYSQQVSIYLTPNGHMLLAFLYLVKCTCLMLYIINIILNRCRVM